MSDIAISVRGVSKKYIIGKQKDGSLRGTLGSLFSKKAASSDEFWALKDVSFDIQRGDVVGIIGKNGAGKSTILKILSQITRPTEGEIEINGRIASLLEVGTGFHPELTGRENIYLNGTILGMTRKEVAAKFDEIVAFSGVEKFIDTPVKHYSSGMYVRLAFAVAAHLEPEILIIDEVLAVGDAEFQKKCLGKMKDVAGEGRTVIFVSHDLGAVKQLCNKGVLLKEGKVESINSMEIIIEEYTKHISSIKNKVSLENHSRSGSGILRVTKIEWFQNGNLVENIRCFIETDLYVYLDKTVNFSDVRVDIGINNMLGNRVCWLSTDVVKSDINNDSDVIKFRIKSLNLAPGKYNLNIYLVYKGEEADWIKNTEDFNILEDDYYGTGKVVSRNQNVSLLIDYQIN